MEHKITNVLLVLKAFIYKPVQNIALINAKKTNSQIKIKYAKIVLKNVILASQKSSALLVSKAIF